MHSSSTEFWIYVGTSVSAECRSENPKTMKKATNVQFNQHCFDNNPGGERKNNSQNNKQERKQVHKWTITYS